MTTAIEQTALGALRDAILAQHGELSRAHLGELANLDRFHQVLVKCGSGRFVASAQDAPGIIACIDEHKYNYVRGVWLLASDPWHRSTNGTWTPADGLSQDD